MTAPDAWVVEDPTLCQVCGREACEDHIPPTLGVSAHAEPAVETGNSAPAATFECIGDGERYVFRPVEILEFQAEHLRRIRDDLYAQVTVRCSLPAARTFGGVVTTSTENLSAAFVRQKFARILAAQSRVKIDWIRMVEEFAIRILEAESVGQPSVLLAEITERSDDGFHNILGIRLASHGVSGIYAAGDSAKSLVTLFLLGELAQRGVPVTLFDFEWEGLPHKQRARKLWPDGDLPPIRYRQCLRPLVHLADDLRRDVVDHGTRYFAIDSVAPACHDKPESADTAIAFSRAARYIAGTQSGQLWLGHVVKNHQAVREGEETFFGSVFWNNLIRCGWFAKAQQTPDSVVCAFHHRKRNGLAQLPSVGISIKFDSQQTVVRRCDLETEAPDLAAGLPLWQRMRDALLRDGPKTVADLADELSAKEDAIRKAAQRAPKLFTKLGGGHGIPPRLALVERKVQ